MARCKVSTFVNHAQNDSLECIRPIEGLSSNDGTISRLLDLWQRYVWAA
jgi:hypothetical protein